MTRPVRTEAERPFSLGYCPELDGLRGVAILLVVLFHAGVPGFERGGYLGVDLFFVLSGFLITSLLLAECSRTGTLRVGRFYLMRLFRLLPALALVCASWAIFSVAFLDQTEIWKEVGTSLSYLANWTRALDWGYPRELGHTWSLAIEEQFYLGWPLILLLVLGRARNQTAVAAALALAALAVMLVRSLMWNAGYSSTRLFFGSDTRADGLLMGCALAFLVGWRVRTSSPAVEAVGRRLQSLSPLWLVALGVTILLCRWDDVYMLTIGLTIANLLFAVTLFCVILPFPFRLRSLLRSRVLVELGRISYGLFLWHSVVLGLMRTHGGWSKSSAILLGIPLSFALAYGTYQWLELPIFRVRARVLGPSLDAARSVPVSASAQTKG